jgi:hypothetical protein
MLVSPGGYQQTDGRRPTTEVGQADRRALRLAHPQGRVLEFFVSIQEERELRLKYAPMLKAQRPRRIHEEFL